MKRTSKIILFGAIATSLSLTISCGKRVVNQNYMPSPNGGSEILPLPSPSAGGGSSTPGTGGEGGGAPGDGGGGDLLKSMRGEVEDILYSKDTLTNDLALIQNNINAKNSILDISENEKELLMNFIIKIAMANNYFKNSKQQGIDDDKVKDCILKDDKFFKKYFENRKMGKPSTTNELEMCADDPNDNKLVLLDNIRINLVDDQGCVDRHGNKKAGSVTKSGYEAEICISILDLQNVSSGDLKRQTLALFLHELSHVVGYDEADAKTIQRIIFNEFDSLYDDHNIKSSHYQLILQNIDLSKKTLDSILAGRLTMAPLLQNDRSGPFTLMSLAVDKNLFADMTSLKNTLAMLRIAITGSFSETKEKNKRNLRIDEINALQIQINSQAKDIGDNLNRFLTDVERLKCGDVDHSPYCTVQLPLYEEMTEFKKSLTNLEKIYLKYEAIRKIKDLSQ